MNALNQPETGPTNLAPILDAAINELGEEDRKAILLRFYERMDLRSVGAALGSSENAAQKRVSRALDQLRVLLTRRGVALSAAGLGTVLAAEAVTAAPAGLAANITVAALAGAVAGSVPLSVFKAMSLTKLKLSALSAIAVIAVATPLMVQHQSQTRLREENDSLHQLLNQHASLAEENQRLSNLVAQASSQALVGEQFRELLRLRGEVGRLRQDNKEIDALRQENRQLRVAQAQSATVVGAANTTVPKPIPLYTRMLKVDANALVAQLKSSYPVTDGNSTQDTFHQAALRQFLKDSGVAIEAPETVFMDEKNGTLTAHTSLENLDKIEEIFATLRLEGKSR